MYKSLLSMCPKGSTVRSLVFITALYFTDKISYCCQYLRTIKNDYRVGMGIVPAQPDGAALLCNETRIIHALINVGMS